MSNDLSPSLDYGPLIEALFTKTREGKIDWRETAEDESFLASIKGAMTYEVRRDGNWCELTAKDRRGRTIFRVSQPYLLRLSDQDVNTEDSDRRSAETAVSALGLLHSAARRIALRIDEQLKSSLELLEKL
jgi:hypothetical protein